MNEILASLGGASASAASVQESILAPLPTASVGNTYEPLEPLTGNTYGTGTTSSIEERALSLLGSGVAAEQVAAALGVTPSRIAQLLSQKVFADRVASLRYTHLQKHNIRDGKYDALEDTLLGKLEKSMPLLIKPESILKAIAVVNNAKRRGQSTPEQVTNQQNIVNLVLPNVIAARFSIDINNQVIKAGDQSLLTMPSGNLLKQVEDAEATRLEHIQEE